MDVAPHKPWTQREFFAWAAAEGARNEFDGIHRVAMTGGNAGHSLVTPMLHLAWDAYLRRGPCRPPGPDAGVDTVNAAARYPDALVTCSEFELADKTIPGVVVVFGVLSPTSGQIDRIVKTREYAAVASIRRDVIIGLTDRERSAADEVWRTTVLTTGDTLRMVEIGIEIPVAQRYEDITFPSDDEAAG